MYLRTRISVSSSQKHVTQICQIYDSEIAERVSLRSVRKNAIQLNMKVTVFI